MRARTIVAGGVAVALLAGGTAYAVASRPRVVNYTTAIAARGTITQVFSASGVVTRSGQSDLTFDAGTVTALAVKVGDQVTKGQQLAQVDTAPLQVSLLQAQAQLAQARAVSDADQVAFDNGGSAASLPSGLSGAGASTTPATAGASGIGGAASGTGTGTATTEQPAYLVALQTSLAKLQTVVTEQQAACAPVYAVIGELQDVQAQLPASLPTSLPTKLATTGSSASASPAATSPSTAPAGGENTRGRRGGTPAPTSASPSGTPSPSASPSVASGSPAPTTPATTSPAPTTTPSAQPTLPVAEAKQLAAQLQACATSMVALATAEQEAGTAIATASTGMQAATQAAQQQLAAAQQQMVASAQAAAQQAAAQAMAEAQAQLAAQAQRAYGSTVTEATLASDRARVLQYEQAVARAQRSLDGATMTSPVDGTVGALSLTAGENSAGRSVTIVAPGAAEVSVEVPLSVRGLVSAGQAAQVGLVGADPDQGGQVSSVSVLATSSMGSPTYTATVAVEDPGMALFAGAKALVSVPLRTASDVVSVPMSAVVKTSDTTGTVQVVTDAYAESARTVQVTTGAFGGGRIEITSGLEPGSLVVLADRRLPVPGGLSQYGGPGNSASPSPTASR